MKVSNEIKECLLKIYQCQLEKTKEKQKYKDYLFLKDEYKYEKGKLEGIQHVLKALKLK